MSIRHHPDVVPNALDHALQLALRLVEATIHVGLRLVEATIHLGLRLIEATIHRGVRLVEATIHLGLDPVEAMIHLRLHRVEALSDSFELLVMGVEPAIDRIEPLLNQRPKFTQRTLDGCLSDPLHGRRILASSMRLR